MYGFAEADGRLMFTQLLAVNGVGPGGVALADSKLGWLDAPSPSHRLWRPGLAQGYNRGGAQNCPASARELARQNLTEVRRAWPRSRMPPTMALVSLGYTSGQATVAVAGLPDDVTDDAERIVGTMRAPKR